MDEYPGHTTADSQLAAFGYFAVHDIMCSRKLCLPLIIVQCERLAPRLSVISWPGSTPVLWIGS